MLVGCGCNCQEDSVSSFPSGPSLASISEMWPSQSEYPNSTGEPGNFPCVVCEALVSSFTYRVYIDDMQQQQPTLFGNFGCVEMLQTPYDIWPGAEQQYPWGGPEIVRAICAWMTLSGPSGPPANASGYGERRGWFWPLHLANTLGYSCGTVPLTRLQLFRYGQPPGPYTYQARLVLEFVGFNGGIGGSPQPGDPLVITSVLQVYYKTPIQNTPLFCLNWFRLDWEKALGNLERRNPDGDGWESYGIGPGNNTSYEFHRGDFPAVIRVRPWS